MTLGTKVSVFGTCALTARAKVLDLQRDGFRSAFVDIAKRQLDRGLQVLTASRPARAARSLGGLATPDSGEERFEEVGESTRGALAAEIELELFPVDVGAITALLLRLLCGLLPVRAENVVFLALLGGAQNFVCLGDLLELLLGLFRALEICVRVPFSRELPIGGLDIFLGRILRHAQDRVVVLKVHSSEVLATITFAGRSNSSPRV